MKEFSELTDDDIRAMPENGGLTFIVEDGVKKPVMGACKASILRGGGVAFVDGRTWQIGKIDGEWHKS